MKALIVYDSYYGNTKEIAEIIKNEFGEDAEMIRAKDFSIDKMNYIDTLVIGSPTRVFRPSSNILKFLRAFPNDILEDKNILIFDTRMCVKDSASNLLKYMIKKFGYAIENIEKIIIKKGGKTSLQSQGFISKTMEGPLYDSEIERAKEWAKRFLKKIETETQKAAEEEKFHKENEEKFEKENK